MIDAHAREPVHLSRPDFCQAAKELVKILSSSSLSPHSTTTESLNHLCGWVWKEDSRMSNYGYLEKQGALLKIKPPRDPLDKDEDDYDHLDDVDSVSTYSVKLFVVYSASFRVPSLLFSLHSASGAPVPLSQIQKSTTFFRQGAPLGDDDNSENATFPAITQEQHPSLEYSCYSLHPCHTPSALAEILSNNLPLHKILFNNTPTHITSSTEHALKILVTWFMITSTAVNLCPL